MTSGCSQVSQRSTQRRLRVEQKALRHSVRGAVHLSMRRVLGRHRSSTTYALEPSASVISLCQSSSFGHAQSCTGCLASPQFVRSRNRSGKPRHDHPHELAEALAWTKAVMTKLGLSLNEDKTSLKDARQERFTFLGYSFGPHYPFKSRARLWISASPSKKSVQRLKTNVRELLVPGNNDPWPEVREDLNRTLRGWSSYFNLGSPVAAFRSVDHYVRERVRGFLARRHKVAGRGTRRFTFDEIHRNREVLCLNACPDLPRCGPCGEAS